MGWPAVPHAPWQLLAAALKQVVKRKRRRVHSGEVDGGSVTLPVSSGLMGEV